MSEKVKNKIPMSEHWFWGSIIDSKATYIQITLASIFINIFGLGSAFYIMTVYDRVMPNSAISSLIALTLGMSIVLIFDFIIKLLRAHFIDLAGSSMEKKVNNSLSKRLLHMILSFYLKLVE